MIEILTGFASDVAAFACHGHVTKSDYQDVLVPEVEKKLAQHDKVRIYYETATDFAGIDPGAVWEDTKVGFAHWSRWERLAVVTDIDWISHTMKLFGFLMPGELQAFPSSQSGVAREWIAQH